jgi:AcrR family transcriptional regulator
MRGAPAAAGTLMRSGRINSSITMRLGRITGQVMRPGRLAYAVTVSRWAPDARERLETAALDLFAENGYEETTVAQIAARAGLNRATFFRHFADKREVLFGGEDVLAGLFGDAIRGAPPGATITECLQAALAAAAAAMTPRQRARAARRVLVVAANTEVQERGLLKHARIAASVSAALRARGADELTARLGAEVGMLAFRIAVEGWMQAGDEEPFALHAAAALSDLQARAAELETVRVTARKTGTMDVCPIPLC